MTVWKRASTPEERHRLLEELEPLWNQPLDMRLGQLIYDAVVSWMQENGKPCAARDISREIFYLEDDDLLTTVAAFVRRHYPPKAGSSSTSS